jgi:hypothetical protein
MMKQKIRKLLISAFPASLLLLTSGLQALPGNEADEYKVATEDHFFAPAFSADPAWNYVYVDSNAVYQCSSFHLEDDDIITIKGEYPRSRSLSWTFYGLTGGDQITDTVIEPDAGSINPFINGNHRKARDRSYTLSVVNADKPDEPAANTLYNRPATVHPFGNFLCSRIYVPDQKTEPFGDTELPTVSLTRDGEVLTGEAMAAAIHVRSNRVVLPNGPTDIIKSGFAVLPTAPGQTNIAGYLGLREAGLTGNPTTTPATHPATNPPVFRAFFNAEHQRCVFFTPFKPEGCGDASLDPDGLGLGNPSNRYIETYVDQGFGRVLVLRGKKPSTPQTWKGNPFVPDQDYDLRYFSICPQESVATWRVGDCIFDEELIADEDGFYTLVLSRPSYRPSNATKKCGVSWATTPPAGDGAGDINLYNIWSRFQLPSPNFAEAAQNVLEAGTEAEVMGDFLPVGEYMSVAEFEARGCDKHKR